jgi:ketosteroid isomerase-like protein
MATLERRIRMLEDEAHIRSVLVAYGFGVDSGDASGTAALYTSDSLTVIDTNIIIDGAEGIHEMVLGSEHQSILPGCAHVMGPFEIRVDGDAAVAVGYATTFTRTDGDIGVWRQSVNRWDLVRRLETWVIARRESRSLDDPSASEFLQLGLPSGAHETAPGNRGQV